MLMVESKGTFKALRKACLEAPVLAFANFYKPFLLETNASKLGFGAVLSPKTDLQSMGTTKRVDAQDPDVAEADEEIHKPVQETAVLARSSQHT